MRYYQDGQQAGYKKLEYYQYCQYCQDGQHSFLLVSCAVQPAGCPLLYSNVFQFKSKSGFERVGQETVLLMIWWSDSNIWQFYINFYIRFT